MGRPWSFAGELNSVQWDTTPLCCRNTCKALVLTARVELASLAGQAGLNRQGMPIPPRETYWSRRRESNPHHMLGRHVS